MSKMFFRILGMQVILLERIEKLGFIGDVVDVKLGFARNFLLPQKKALRATEANLEYFKNKRAEIEANNLKLKNDAEKAAAKMNDVSIVLTRQASDSGFLFGSVRPSDIVEELAAQGYKIAKGQVRIAAPIKMIGTYQVGIVLHPEVSVNVSVRVMTAQEQTTQIDEEPADSEQA